MERPSGFRAAVFKSIAGAKKPTARHGRGLHLPYSPPEKAASLRQTIGSFSFPVTSRIAAVACGRCRARGRRKRTRRPPSLGKPAVQMPVFHDRPQAAARLISRYGYGRDLTPSKGLWKPWTLRSAAGGFRPPLPQACTPPNGMDARPPRRATQAATRTTSPCHWACNVTPVSSTALTCRRRGSWWHRSDSPRSASRKP